MITFTVESWRACKAEMSALWPDHYKEIAIHQDAIPLDPDIEQYDAMCDSGALCVVVGREAGRIVGYHISMVKPHLHYRRTLHAFTDIYYLRPDLRKTGAGAAMFKAVSDAWIARGVVKGFSAYKLAHPLAKLFAADGWEETETVITKLFK